MKPIGSILLRIALAALLLAALAVWYYRATEARWEAEPYQSKAAARDEMLGAARWLERHGYRVTTHATLAEATARPLDGGVLLLADSDGTLDAAPARALLRWVEAGNTLILRPGIWLSDRTGKDPDEKGDEDGIDFAEHYLGVVLHYEEAPEKAVAASGARGGPGPQRSTPTQSADPAVTVTLPGGAYPLALESEFPYLYPTRPTPAAEFSDPTGRAIRAYRRVRGRIVVLADNPFTNRQLRRYDHAELLLGLTRLAGDARRVYIVHGLSVPPWYETLWSGFAPGITGAGVLIALALWAAVRRFGPLLPDPATERRALMEHIDASARWLWRLPPGRALLLGAARDAALDALRRRAPRLLRLSADERHRALAAACALPEAELKRAFEQPASANPQLFTRQIRTLHHVRKHYER